MPGLLSSRTLASESLTGTSRDLAVGHAEVGGIHPGVTSPHGLADLICRLKEHGSLDLVLSPGSERAAQPPAGPKGRARL